MLAKVMKTQHMLHSKRSPLSQFILCKLFGGNVLRKVDIETLPVMTITHACLSSGVGKKSVLVRGAPLLSVHLHRTESSVAFTELHSNYIKI